MVVAAALTVEAPFALVLGFVAGLTLDLAPPADHVAGRWALALMAVVFLHLLTVKLDRLTRWHQPGLLAIGDAAHAMSPIGGIGINLAIQDAVAAANALAGPLAKGDDVDPLLHRVQGRRKFPTRVIQSAQKFAQDRIIGRLLQTREPISKAPLAIRLLDRFPVLRRVPGRMIGLGVRRERVLSPKSP